jgi:hypothetical protein
MKPVSALLERGVVNKASFSMAGKGVLNKVSFKMAVKGHGQ